MLRRRLFIFCMATVLLSVATSTRGATAKRESIDAFARRYGFGVPLRMGVERVLRSKYSSVVFTAGSRKLRFNNTLVWLNTAIEKDGPRWTIASYDSMFILDPLLRPSATVKGDDITTIVLDPGHGGSDSGAIGHRRVYEKKAVLDVAKTTRDLLRAQGYSVKLTREHDRFIPLSKRTALARRWGADLFISIHFNASDNSSVSGIETYICSSPGFSSTMGSSASSQSYRGNQYDKKNTLLGYCLHRATLRQVKAIDRGLKHARFEVLRKAPCPAALIECGFISNKKEAARVITPQHRAALARGIANGILSYATKTKNSP